ncbi:MAG: MBL fold metallo-hydrolase RNA specificity domain-containing protein [Candidatus Micrarchaeota archaeon]
MDRVTFYGAASEVGRSCIFIESHENTMLDCGIKLEGRKPVPPEFDLKQSSSVDQLIISHSHLDHVGYAPALYQHGFSGKTLLTKPTRDIAQVLLADALKIQGDKFFNAHSVDKLMKHTKLLDYKQRSGGVEMRDAGHILGSAMTFLDTSEHRILYTGDVNLRQSKLLEGADIHGLEADTLIIEGTYGNTTRQSTKKTVNTFINHIGTTLKRGGKVLVPTFAIGRGQEVLLTLEAHMLSKVIPHCPIFLDGMVKKVMKIHRHNATHLKREIQMRILTSDDDPFKSEFYREPQMRNKQDVFDAGRAIIVASSGMLVGGPAVRYFKKLAPEPKNAVIIVGYQANDTPGRELIDGKRDINLGGTPVQVNCQVETAPFSGHSDAPELLNLTKHVKGLKQIFVVHCEPTAGAALAKSLHKHTGVKTHLPTIGQTFELRY